MASARTPLFVPIPRDTPFRQLGPHSGADGHKDLDEDRNEVPDGVTGEIVIRGENVMAGYWKNPEATAKTVIDGWLYTGDRGYLYPENRRYLYVTGRFKSLLIAADGDKYSPEGYEDNLTSVSKFIDQVIIP